MLAKWNDLQEKQLEEGLHQFVSWSDLERRRNGATRKEESKGSKTRINRLVLLMSETSLRATERLLCPTPSYYKQSQ